MRDHMADALMRYDFARDKVAGVDSRIQQTHLDAHVTAGARLAGTDRDGLAALLADQAELSEDFATSARALADALRGADHPERSA